jgi:hypothetical protein
MSLSLRLETMASSRRFKRPLLLVGHGFLVRNRRLATAILRLGAPNSYEARILLRTMLEIKINYSWIRSQQSHSRALRFLRYGPLERLRLLERVAPELPQADYAAKKLHFKHERSRVRHLFRTRDSKGKLRWADSWATVNSVERRLQEVMTREQPANPDMFLYGLYILLSSAVHGSPGSLDEMFKVQADRLVTKAQPEDDPELHLVGALLVLVWTIDAFASDAGLKRALGTDWRELSKSVKQFASLGTVLPPPL